MKRFLLIAMLIAAVCLAAVARQPQKGYRGFVEWSNSLRSDNFATVDLFGNFGTERQTTFFTGLTTSHGYQINPMFFIGAGLGFEKCTKYDNWVAPIFIEGRADFRFGKFTPFADLRLGANLAEGTGVYFSPSIGYRFNWGRKTGINIAAGLTLAGYRAEHYDLSFTGPDSYEIYYTGTRRHVRPYFSFRLGIDF